MADKVLGIGYVDGREFATETALALLIGVLSQEQKDQLQWSLNNVRKQFKSENAPPASEDFKQGFDECLLRLESFFQVRSKSGHA